jgi:GTP cyclohydrolase IA
LEDNENNNSINQQSDEQISELTLLYKKVLKLLGEDPGREGLLATPKRVAKAMTYLTKGYKQSPADVLKSAIFHVDYDEIVLVKNIDVFSLCEHHLLPIIGKAHVAYLPAGKIVGLSKIPRVVNIFSRRLQVQERLTVQIKDAIQDAIDPAGVAVIIEAKHMCMVMRGVEENNSITTTSSMSGEFLNNHSTRSEFMRLIFGNPVS